MESQRENSTIMLVELLLNIVIMFMLNINPKF